MNSPTPEKGIRQPPKPTKSATAKLGQNGDRQASRRAAIVLEVLAGVRTPGQAAQALQLSVSYYYLLERRALEGLLAACQVQPKGPPGSSLKTQVEQLKRQLEQCRNECQRQAALVRATQRAVGIPSPPPDNKSRTKDAKGRKRRRCRPAVRALKAVEQLRKNSCLESSAEEVQQNDSSQPEPTSSQQENSHGTRRQEATSRSTG